MYQINDLIIYGSSGVCRVEDIGIPEISGIDKDKQYYILRPLHSKGNVIYTPIQNSKVNMRKIISKDQANELIESIPSISAIETGTDKEIGEQYRSAIGNHDCKGLIQIIKTVYMKQQDKITQKKKICQTDERYMKQAEELLYSELAVVLDLQKENMRSYIETKIEERQLV